MSSTRTTERLARILAMVPWVIAHPGETAEDVCARFGYEERSELVKDLNLVLMCGLPGYGPGDLIDVSFDEDEVVIDMADYFAHPLRLTAAEGLMMLAGGMAMLSTQVADPALVSAVQKLSRVLLPEEGLVDIDLGSEPALVALLRDAAARHQVVRLVYTAIASGETTTRDVESWSVSASMGNWYLTGHCRLAGSERVFRVDRIRSADLTGESFPESGDPTPTAIRYSPGVDDIVVHIHLSPEASWVADYYPVTLLGTGPSGTEIEFAASDIAVIARLLLRLGASARLTGGPGAAAAQEALDDLRGRVLARY